MRYNIKREKTLFHDGGGGHQYKRVGEPGRGFDRHVSRVINNPQLVQPDTREHVLEVMRRVNYAPAWTVESRMSSRSRLIAFLI